MRLTIRLDLKYSLRLPWSSENLPSSAQRIGNHPPPKYRSPCHLFSSCPTRDVVHYVTHTPAARPLEITSSDVRPHIPTIQKKFLFWPENFIANRICEWTGPFPIINLHHDKKLAHIQISDGEPTTFKISETKPYFEPGPLSSSFINSLSDPLIPVVSDPSASNTESTPLRTSQT